MGFIPLHKGRSRPQDSSHTGSEQGHSSNMSQVYKIVLLRHGESTWNKENRFTGWYDADLSETGVAEAINAGKVCGRGLGFLNHSEF